ncbi:MAG: polysaccharide deacetylase family protein, partial [bacterium]
LTFDDGPHPYYTEQLLALLKEENIHATFLYVGSQAQAYPDLVRFTADEGHTIGNHTFSHINLTTLSDTDVRREIADCNEVLDSITGVWPRFFRPPGGNYDQRIIAIAGEEGCLTALWTANSGDYAMTDPVALRRKVVSRTGPGGIILLHSGIPATIDALPGIIADFRARGYRFVTLDELYPAPPVVDRVPVTPLPSDRNLLE